MKPLVVGIAGGSASGKTTLTSALTEYLREGTPSHSVEVFPLDRYFYRGAPGGPRFKSPSTGEDLPDNNHPNSADNTKLVADLDQLCESPDAPEIVILEGLMLLHVPEIRSRIALKLFIQLDGDLRAIRRLLRDMKGGRGSTDPEWIATYYRECAREGHNNYVEPSKRYADLIIPGDAPTHRSAILVAGAIRSLLNETSIRNIS